MKKSLMLVIAVALLAISSVAFAAPAVDVRDFGVPGPPPTYWQDPIASPTSSPYYRWWNQDWGWQHGSIVGTFSGATLNISAFDVDANDPVSPEVDKIYAKDNGVWTYVGTLAGANNIWSYTTFTLDSNFYDDIVAGLEVWIDIDTTHTSDYWAVSLAKSALSVDGGTIPGPNPTPEPTSMLLIVSGLAGLAIFRKKFNS
jgi:hypothetical protein